AKVDGILERLDMLTTWLMRHVQAAEAKFLDHEGRIVAIEQRFGPLPQPAL
ncbi:MAG: hypothetical protein HY303_18785, partial [Candidatus Wallbacteria bacterium]|nr:hypothetical protein [Candidatus Wallbacteria bacterium]